MWSGYIGLSRSKSGYSAKLLQNFLGFVKIAAIAFWLRSLNFHRNLVSRPRRYQNGCDKAKIHGILVPSWFTILAR